MEITAQDEKILKKFPFLRDFPFPSFSITSQPYSVGWYNGAVVPLGTSLDVNLFTYFEEDLNRKTNISIFDHELEWLSSISKNITNLDKINEILDNALEETDLLAKRDYMRQCLEWLIKLNDGKASLSFTVFSDVMVGLMDFYKVVDPTKFISTINKLANNRGLIIIDDAEYHTLIAFYDFHFIYTKVMLGIIIASKLSV